MVGKIGRSYLDLYDLNDDSEAPRGCSDVEILSIDISRILLIKSSICKECYASARVILELGMIDNERV